MTEINSLFLFRLRQAEETLQDAQKMLEEELTPRSIINRAYYSMFYAVLALLLKFNVHIKTSKHIGVISIFDKEFVRTGKIDKNYSKILHKMFNIRQQGDYKELAELTSLDSKESVKSAMDFLEMVKGIIR